MRFQPKTDEELYKLLAKGEYDFEVIEAEEKKSKAGNDMIEIQVKVFTNDGNVILKDWLLDNGKLKRFCQAIGQDYVYESGELRADSLKGEGGVCKVDIEKQEGYSDRNKIAGYVPRKAQKDPTPKPDPIPPTATKANQKAMQSATANEDIPF